MDEQKVLEKDSWAVVEVMGHNVFAGKVSQHVIGGSGFIRVDVPEQPEERHEDVDWNGRKREIVTPAVPAFTKLIGAGSIYAITPCTEAVAKKVAASRRAVPVSVVDLNPYSRLLEAAEDDDDEAPVYEHEVAE